MRLHHALLLAVLPAQALVAQATQSGAAQDVTSAQVVARMEARRSELLPQIRVEVRKRMEGAARSMAERIRSGHDGDLIELARRQVTARLGKLKPAQTDLLAFCVLAEAARQIASPTEVDEALKVESPLDVEQTARLRQALERDSGLMSALSNIMLWTADAQPTILVDVK